LQTTFSFKDASGVTSRALHDSTGEILAADFAPAALVRRINKGLRRRKDENQIGFMIDPKSGYWASVNRRTQEDDEPTPTRMRQRITPVVEDHKNALLIRFPSKWIAAAGDGADAMVGTIQHGLMRGIEAVFQLEEGEILVEPTPARKGRRALLFYEAAEGGAGALSRLIQEKSGFRTIARKALEIMHYQPSSIDDAATKGSSALIEVPDARCVAGCYRCLLSYFNQPDHELIDRRQEPALQFLLRLAFADPHDPHHGTTVHAGLKGCPAPDPTPMVIDGYPVDLIWRAARVAAAEQDSAPADLSARLAAKGIELVLLPSEGDARSLALANLATVLGGVPV
jgi:hypothetical protein